MANDKRFLAWKMQHRRRKAAKAKVKLYEQGKITYDQLNALARIFPPAQDALPNQVGIVRNEF